MRQSYIDGAVYKPFKFYLPKKTKPCTCYTQILINIIKLSNQDASVHYSDWKHTWIRWRFIICPGGGQFPRTSAWWLGLCVLLQLMQRYEVQLRDAAPAVEPKTRTLLIPAKPIDLRFLARAWWGQRRWHQHTQFTLCVLWIKVGALDWIKVIKHFNRTDAQVELIIRPPDSHGILRFKSMVIIWTVTIKSCFIIRRWPDGSSTLDQ